jgi:hypothetical protein
MQTESGSALLELNDIQHTSAGPAPFILGREQSCTEQFYLFYQRHFSIFDFFFFGINLATTVDRQRLIAGEALAFKGTEKDLLRLEELKKNENPTFKKLQRFADLQSENMCIRSVDNFICYLSEIIQSCAIRKPEILRSSEMVKIEDVLRFSSQKAMIAYLIDRKINELTYGGKKRNRKVHE